LDIRSLLTASSTLALVVTPILVAERLTRFVLRRFFPEQPPGALWWWKRQQYEQNHLDIVLNVSHMLTGVLRLSAMLLPLLRALHNPALIGDLWWFHRPGFLRTLLVGTAVDKAVMRPLARYRGPGTALLVDILGSTLFVAPAMHALINEAMRKIVVRGENKVLDIGEA
jgi:hypothetical protein